MHLGCGTRYCQPYAGPPDFNNPMKGLCYNCGGDHFAKECAAPVCIESVVFVGLIFIELCVFRHFYKASGVFRHFYRVMHF